MKKMQTNERKLTDEQKEEIIRRYIESRTDPSATPLTQTQLAKEYGVCQQTISKVICNSDVIERVRKRTKADVLLAQAMAEMAAPKIMRETIKSALQKRDKKFEYITQGDRRDVLDRAGVRVKTEEKQAIDITFNGGEGFGLGMPEGDR